ncbi:hypothetical protein [Wenzhouxiangella sp. EGI_FJ10305]|uniref:hypothetical protein n=1 Tax=Wenzhouxiangella sp. EGI_FJ10305 TaxID=3243768 RepID=UPI0035E2BA80
MSKLKLRELLGAAGFALVATSAAAGGDASGCDDLSAIAATPLVDFQSQVQPVLDDCANCHGESGPADLDLRADEAYDNLVGVISTTNASRLRVDPFDPDSSSLFLAVSCDSPGGPGFRMPGTSPEERALIRDWIAQGAPAEPASPPEAVAVPAGTAWSLTSLVAALILLAGIHLRRHDSIRNSF